MLYGAQTPNPGSTYLYSLTNINDPLVDFYDFFNGEDLQQKDLVLYLNFGMHHVPDTSDLSTTVFTNAQPGATIRPQNYFARDASRATKQQANIAEDGVVTFYGQKRAQGQVDLNKRETDLETIFKLTDESYLP
ncbi:uncharacterized protein HMPREF1541_10573 [Cyphellophora europaea CBS 101466]|uniref:Copper amine oxidase catalytic domain-containing protein n=1 Tax=Cyphellophora europaea (strain CBS 101466) TaxID=1220924 RepID=W2S8Q5_CYPE1|nr:uncharacterized protein HMPREF1541_10573 [Cyphellophora europaea CBS 101466]ETN44393.1 hypothetical protein HMPREF1541_10573 [Cyphellophora europaea CBS 101466]